MNYLEQITNSELTLISDLAHDIAKRTLAVYTSRLKEYGLTFQQTMVILLTARYQDTEQKIYQKDLERMLGLTNPSVTSLVKTLVANDYIYRIQDESDGRYYHLHLTPKSAGMTEDLARTIHESNEMFENLLTKKENEQLIPLMQKLSDQLKKTEERMGIRKQY
ncbi:MAG: MarR family transcriptional regulator [Bulleidia sp.]|nr:MarR family transcriptional regulator [Bulleidia sp.]